MSEHCRRLIAIAMIIIALSWVYYLVGKSLQATINRVDNRLAEISISLNNIENTLNQWELYETQE